MHNGGTAPVRLHKLGMGRAPRIAIVGAGVGGLTLAGILSRKLPRARLSILERHPQIDGCDHEGGYGLSVDEFGQEALVRAGLFDRFWSISRPRSDLVRLFPLQGAEPIHTSWPRYVECQTNRAGLRSVLLEALAERKHRIRYDCHVTDARLSGPSHLANNFSGDAPSSSSSSNKSSSSSGKSSSSSKSSSRLELISSGGESLGEYDCVVDASGLYSSLRHLRVEDPAGGPHFTGCSVIHGVIEDPDAQLAASGRNELAERLGEGTCRVVGRGFGMTLQRFGASASDRRAAFFYWVHTPDEERASELARGINGGGGGCDGSGDGCGGGSGGSDVGGDSLETAKGWLKADMAKGRFDDVWYGAIDGLTQASALALYGHSSDSKMRPDSAPAPSISTAAAAVAEDGRNEASTVEGAGMGAGGGDDSRLAATGGSIGGNSGNGCGNGSRLPLVCSGDALLSLGLAGGGSLAMRDALELAEVLTAPGAFCPQSGQLDGSALDKLRKVEAAALSRKASHQAAFEKVRGAITHRAEGADPLRFGLGDFAVGTQADGGGGSGASAVWQLGMNLAGWAWRHVHRVAKWRNGGEELGNDERSLLHPMVTSAMAEEQKIEERWLGIASTIRVLPKWPSSESSFETAQGQQQQHQAAGRSGRVGRV